MELAMASPPSHQWHLSTSLFFLPLQCSWVCFRKMKPNSSIFFCFLCQLKIVHFLLFVPQSIIFLVLFFKVTKKIYLGLLWIFLFRFLLLDWWWITGVTLLRARLKMIIIKVTLSLKTTFKESQCINDILYSEK